MKKKYLVGFAIQSGDGIQIFGTKMRNKIIEYGDITEKDIAKIEKALFIEFELDKGDRIITMGITPLPLISK